MRSLLLLVCLLVGSAGPVWALRCGSAVVSKGASKVEVLHKCGEPTFVEELVIYEVVLLDPSHAQHGAHRYEVPLQRFLAQPDYSMFPYEMPLGYRFLAPPQVVEDWTYNFGPHRFLYRLRFHRGVLHQMHTGGYGY